MTTTIVHAPGSPLRTIIQEYNDGVAKAAADYAIAKAISIVLERHYPGHQWLVGVASDQGVAYVKLPMLSARLGFVVKLAALNADPAMKAVVEAGGALLEFWNLPRSPWRQGAYDGAVAGSLEFGKPR